MDLHGLLSKHLFSLVESASSGDPASTQSGKVAPCMKALLADPHSLAQVSLCCPQSSMMEAGVYLFQTLEEDPEASAAKERMPFLTCVVLVAPTASALSALQSELRRPQFGRYHIFLTGHVSRARIKALAEADVHEVVANIAETPIDFLPLEPHFVVLQPSPPTSWATATSDSSMQASRTVSGLYSLLSSLRMRPRIAHSKGSVRCRSVAGQLEQRWAEGVGAAGSAAQGNITLLLLDRGCDPVTPLLTQWTYQAMIQEIFGIRNGVVDLSEFDVPPDQKKVVLSSSLDEFFGANMYKNFGDIGEIVRQLVQDYQSTVAGHQKIDSIGDIRDFVSSYPEFKKITGTVTKHVSLISELSKIVSANHLLTISEFEQNLVCGQDSSTLASLLEILGLPNLREMDAKRLILLYALKGPEMTTKDLATLCDRANLDRPSMSNLIRGYKHFCRSPSSSSAGKPGGVSAAGTRLEKKTKSLLRGLRGVDNVYTQYEPGVKKYVTETLQQRFLADLEYTKSFAFAGQDVLVFLVGGATYEESRWVHDLNQQNGARVMLGGDCVWNAKAFIKYLETKGEETE